MEKTDKPKRRRAKKPLGSHPLGEKHMAARMAELDRAKEWMADNKPFYQTPPGGEPVIPHEPPRMTIERLADDYRELQWFSSPWCEWHEWERYRDEMV